MCAGMRVTYVKPGNVFNEDVARVAYHWELGSDPLPLGDLALMGVVLRKVFVVSVFVPLFFFSLVFCRDRFLKRVRCWR